MTHNITNDNDFKSYCHNIKCRTFNKHLTNNMCEFSKWAKLINKTLEDNRWSNEIIFLNKDYILFSYTILLLLTSSDDVFVGNKFIK